ncbi:MAG TPA: adenylate/guanylate cyclase domain-containing protein [Stellaceae bacterium]|nr:adenylate/guanylate cyclase domain-containing protein [Stellaceae bacterium]
MVDAAAPLPKVNVKFRGLLGNPVLQSLAIVLVTTVIALWVSTTGMGDKVEQWTKDIRMIAGVPLQPAPDPNVMIVSITEKVLDQFPYRTPVDRAYLAEVLEVLASKHVRAIGLDVLLDTPTDPAKDEILRQTIRQIPMPLLISYVDDPRIEDNPARLKYLNDFVPPINRGMANVPTDRDGVVRSIYPGEMRPDGSYQLGLARAILDRLGIKTPQAQPTLIYRRDTVQGSAPFTELPANLALLRVLPDALFKNKIVMVGADEALIDRHLTPFSVLKGEIDGSIPGITIHAEGVAQLLEKTHLNYPPMSWIVGITVLLALLDTILSRLPLALWVRFGGSILIVGAYVVAVALTYWHWQLVLPVVAPVLAVGLSAWLSDTVIGRLERRQRSMIQGAMSRYVSPKLVKELIDDPSKLQLGGDRREMSFLFTDVADFTTLSEGMTSEQLTAVLNEYLTGACKIIIEDFDGTVCSFIGDAIFALWNAPLPQPDHRQRIVKCAMAVSAYAEEFCARQKAAGVPFGHTRIGLHCGEAVIGNFGAPDKLSYTAIGDAVNLSARLEGVNKYFGTRVCISETIASQVPEVTFRPIANIIVKGKSLPVPIFEPMTEEQVRSGFHARYQAAFDLMAAKEPAAHNAFRELAAAYPEDGPIHYHLDRLDEGESGSLVAMDEK